MKASHLKKLERFRVVLSDMREELDNMAGVYRDKMYCASERWQRSKAGEACDFLQETLEQVSADVESAESAIADIVSGA